MLQWLIWARCLNLYVMFLFCVVKIMHSTRIIIPSIIGADSFVGPLVSSSISAADLREAILDQVSTLAGCSHNDISRLIKQAPGVWVGEIHRSMHGIDVHLLFMVSISN